MAALRVRRTWWIVQHTAPEAPLFRLLSRRWRPVVRTERRIVPFQLSLAATDAPPPSRASFGRKKIEAPVETTKKSARAWNPWMHMR